RMHPSMWVRGFFSNRLYLYPGVRDPALPYISDARVHARMKQLNGRSAKALAEDKSLFADALVARGLGGTAPEVYGIITGGSFRPRSESAARRVRDLPAVVVKPVAGAGGRGVRLVAGAEVESYPAEPDVDLLVQEVLVQHPVLAAVNPASLNTLRVLAVRLPGGPELVAAVHRWGTAATGAVDNVSAGGLCSHVDLATGVVGPAVGAPRGLQRVQHDEHPDTGARIAGLQLPHWQEVRELVGALMSAFPELDHVGWDLCVTGGGVRVVEANATMPNPNIFQYHGPFATDPQVRRYYVDRGLLPAARG
ncbi:MAG: hypothetical protein AVDCRST_MAG35-2705, partial [uncultured Quadrisphaera sp.]